MSIVPPVIAGPVERQPPPLVGLSPKYGGRLGGRHRLIGGLVAAGCGTLLFTAASLTPNPKGLGTHCQLGMPTCGFLLISGLPCPTCGMTTAFAHMVRGQPLKSVAAQPLGALLCLGVAAAAVGGLLMMFTARTITIDWYRLSPAGLAFGTAVAVFVAWGIKTVTGFASGVLPYRL